MGQAVWLLAHSDPGLALWLDLQQTGINQEAAMTCGPHPDWAGTENGQGEADPCCTGQSSRPVTTAYFTFNSDI